MKMTSLASLSSLCCLILLSGCASSRHIPETCRYPERDLTAAWNTRHYWCLPDDYRPQPLPVPPKPLVEKTEKSVVEMNETNETEKTEKTKEIDARTYPLQPAADVPHEPVFID